MYNVGNSVIISIDKLWDKPKVIIVKAIIQMPKKLCLKHTYNVYPVLFLPYNNAINFTHFLKEPIRDRHLEIFCDDVNFR